MNISDIFAPNYVATSVRRRSPFDPPDAPDVQPDDSAPAMPIQVAPNPQNAPDINRDIYAPRLAQIGSQLEDLYAPRKVGTGRQVLGAILSAVTRNPQLGGLVTGDTQRMRQIQPLQQEYGLVSNEMAANRALQTQELNNENTQADIALRQAQGNYFQRHANVLENPPVKPTPQEDIWQGYLKQAGGDPVKARQMQLQDEQDAKPGPKQTPAHVTYNEGIPVSVTDRDGTTYDANDPNLPPNLRPLVSSANAAHQQHVQEAADTQARSFANQEKTREQGQTAQTRADMAKNLNENFDQLEEILNRRPELFGPVAGRITGLKEKIGTNDPDISALETIGDMIGRAQTSAHSMRNGQLVEKATQAILNSYHNGPKAVHASIQAARNSVGTFMKDVGEQPQTSAASPAASAGNFHDFGSANGKPEGSTGTLNGTPVIVRRGRIVSQ